ncbi:ATP-binding protein [Burkholderia territorii]|uniref:ATP-binding protein n=1 Tax=Burkholderia territorii TaxID=1503055 RepID=UPI000758EC3B|nr:ATP-binding protein [Burkholderia territorii]KWE32921.1 hypothetical protein WT49_19175 [Burkholderia territorii]KWE46921.1 hypothetical protein WT51_16710 [Burkholderia territorii]KWE47168.1 hypothetical protein WT50_08650 [Burkholderia territorii]
MSLFPSPLPTETKAAAASAAREGELQLLDRYQRGLLFGGGAALSLAIVLAVCLSAYGTIRDYIAEGRSVFLSHKALLQVAIETRQALFSRTVIASELLWADHHKPHEALLREFIRSGGHALVRASDQTAPQLALGQITEHRPPSSFEHYLGFAEEHGYAIGAAERQRGSPLYGYLYSPDDTFISIMPPPASQDPAHWLGAADTAALIRRLAPDIGDLSNPAVAAQLLTSRRAICLPPAVDPLSGESVFRLVQPAFDGDKPFLVFVADVPVRALADQLRRTPYDGEFLVLDRDGRIILHSDPAPVGKSGLAQWAVDSGQWRAGYRAIHDGYHDGMFTVSDRLDGTDWVLVYAYSWETVLAALAPTLLPRALAMLVVLCLLWLFLLHFKRSVFAPIHARAQRVFESEQLNRSIISTAPVGLGLLSIEHGSVLLQNDVMAKYFSMARQKTLRPEKLLMRLYQHASSSGQRQADAAPVSRELSIERADGTVCDLLVSVVRTKYLGADSLLCSLSDITANKNIERQLEQARIAADDANRAKSAFLAAMSHEVRTPLNAMLGHLELLEHTRQSGADGARLRTIESSAHALLDVINDILDFSKVESGQMTLENIRFDFRDTVEQVIAMLGPLAKAKNLALSCRVDAAIAPHYCGDPIRIRQIVVNLVGNAIKFTSAGYVSVNVRCATGAASPLLVSVTDTGIGIPEDAHDTIFEVFGQADPTIARRFGGTGLGLALCKRMVELMGGSIAVASRRGEGSTFTLTLPLRPGAERLGTTLHETATSTSRAPAGRSGIRLLVAEDHPLNRELIRDQLDSLGHEVSIVENGVVALQYFNRYDYDAVLTDLAMPVMDGYTLAACLRRQGATVPIIAITANVTTEARLRCQQAGMSDVLIKPMSRTSIDRCIRQHLRGVGDATAETSSISTAANIGGHPLRDNALDLLRRSTDDSFLAIDHALRSGDLGTVLEHIHSIKGAFAMICLQDVVDACVHVEQLGEDGNRDTFIAAVERLTAVVTTVLESHAPEANA